MIVVGLLVIIAALVILMVRGMHAVGRTMDAANARIEADARKRVEVEAKLRDTRRLALEMTDRAATMTTQRDVLIDLIRVQLGRPMLCDIREADDAIHVRSPSGVGLLCGCAVADRDARDFDAEPPDWGGGCWTCLGVRDLLRPEARA